MRDKRFVGGLASLALLISLLGFASAARAGTKDGQFAVEESGRTKCAAFVAARTARSKQYDRYIGFIEGYLTAANRYEPNTFDLSPWHNGEAFGLILNEYCKRNPDSVLAMGAQQLVIAMAPIRLADFSKLVEVGDDKQKTIIYETILKRAEDALMRKGLYSGPLDGNYSPQFKESIRQYQLAAKLDPTGLPDPATLWMLLNP